MSTVPPPAVTVPNAVAIVAPSLGASDDALRAANDDAEWRTLAAFSLSRIIISLILAITYLGFQRFQPSQETLALLSTAVLAIYFLAAIGFLQLARKRTSSVAMQVTVQVVMDVICISLLMHAAGGGKSGVGLLLLYTLAGAGLISRGRMAYFHAALAALAILLEQSWQILALDAPVTDFIQGGLLASSYFVIAGLGHTLAQYTRGAERIAAERGVDLANLAQINQLVIRDIQDGFIVVDGDGLIRQHNPQSEVLIGGLAGADGQALATHAPQLADMLANWRRNRDHIFPMVRDPATQRDYQVRFIAIGNTQPAPTVVFVEDAGRIRTQAQQMKLVALGRLTASIAHEIRNPLSSINHAAELLLEGNGSGDEKASEEKVDGESRRLLEIIRTNAFRLDRMVQEVLYLNRRDRAHPETIDVRAYLEQFQRDFCNNEKIAEAVIKVTVADLQIIMFDRSHLDQILWNLTRNACRHGSGKPGSIVIACARGRLQSTLIEVRDDGPGVAIDSLPHLFEPFFTTDSQGTGLGLYIARELAEGNDARLDYLPQQAGATERGGCFRITMKSAIA